MTAIEAISIAGTCIAIASSIIAPAIIVGRYLGSVTATLEQHKAAHDRHDASAIRQGERLQELGEKFSELRGEVRGRTGGDFSGAHRG